MTRNLHLLRWFLGNEEAVEFVAQLWTAIQEWDDLVDEGKCEDASTLVAWWAFGKEVDPFFRAHAELLRPVLHSAYLDWTAANVLDHGDENDVAKAYVLRAGFYRVCHFIAALIGGDLWAREIGPEIWREYGESLAGLRAEMQGDLQPPTQGGHG